MAGEIESACKNETSENRQRAYQALEGMAKLIQPRDANSS